MTYVYVLAASTHNHEGPDVIGVWGPSYLQRGVDDQYVQHVVTQMERAVRQAEQDLRPVRAWFGTAGDESLLGDNRLPVVKDGVLRVLRFTDLEAGREVGLVVQWNCHPEALGADNQLITADFPAATIASLSRRYACPVVYFTGAIGGLLAPPPDRIRDEQGQLLAEGDFAIRASLWRGSGASGRPRDRHGTADPADAISGVGGAHGCPDDERVVPLGPPVRRHAA